MTSPEQPLAWYSYGVLWFAISGTHAAGCRRSSEKAGKIIIILTTTPSKPSGECESELVSRRSGFLYRSVTATLTTLAVDKAGQAATTAPSGQAKELCTNGGVLFRQIHHVPGPGVETGPASLKNDE